MTFSGANSVRHDLARIAATIMQPPTASAKYGLNIMVTAAPRPAIAIAQQATGSRWPRNMQAASAGRNAISATCSRCPKTCIGRMVSTAAANAASGQRLAALSAEAFRSISDVVASDTAAMTRISPSVTSSGRRPSARAIAMPGR